jgi:lytic murein transglycosylase
MPSAMMLCFDIKGGVSAPPGDVGQGALAMSGRTFRWALVGAAMGFLASGCESQELSAPSPKPPPSSPAPPSAGSGSSPAGIVFKSSGDSQFDSWREQFSGKALSAGRDRSVVIEVLTGLTPVDPEIQIAAFDNQAEFVKPIWDYAKSAVSPTRVANGQARLAENSAVFDGVEASFATPREIVAAVWGMESSYGAFIGDMDAPRMLATQAATGRRKDFNEGELMAIMQLVENGSATRDQFQKASWAGAVGQTQFMPTTFLAHARDFDRDGRKDLWTNTGDALASAANYLTNSGWKEGEPWAIEVKLPGSFDYSIGDGRKLAVGVWKTMNIEPAATPAFPGSDALQAELFLPAGSYGPAFLLFDNFYVIKKYNNADSYALAIGLLADRLAGRPDLSRPWPTDIVMLTQDQARELQTALNKLGYDAGAVDGIIGRGTRGALQRFQKDKGLVADGFPTTDMLEKVVAAAA